MSRLFFLIALSLSFIHVHSLETVIQGSVKGFNGKVLKLSNVKDYITNSKEEIAKVSIVEGKFRLEFQLENVQQVFIQIEDKKTSLFAEPGAVYNINLTYASEANEGRAFDKYLDLYFSFPNTGELNQLIKRFNTAYQDFISEHYQQIVIKAAHQQTEAFINEWQQKEQWKQKKFVSDYVTYALASLENINGTSKKKLFESYLNNKSILYSNKEYMNFFGQFYRKDFEQLALTKNGAQVLKAIMLEKSLDQTLKLIQEFKTIDNLALAELYLINGLFEVYYKKTIDQESSVFLLQEVAKNGKTYTNRAIASNIIKTLIQFDKNEFAPQFTLINEKDEKISLSDFKGKPVYLSFWADWSIPSLRELKVISTLHDKYADKVHFVSINLDDDVSKMKQTKEKYKYDWTFLHYGTDYELREKYGVRTVPSYFLIDSDGKMKKAFVEGPTEVERRFYEMK